MNWNIFWIIAKNESHQICSIWRQHQIHPFPAHNVDQSLHLVPWASSQTCLSKPQCAVPVRSYLEPPAQPLDRQSRTRWIWDDLKCRYRHRPSNLNRNLISSQLARKACWPITCSTCSRRLEINISGNRWRWKRINRGRDSSRIRAQVVLNNYWEK